MEKKRFIHLEIMRILATIFVIYIHTADLGYLLYAKYPVNHVLYWANLLLCIFSEMAVPLFLAISGAIYLNRKDESFRSIYCKRILRVFIIFVIAFWLYFWNDMRMAGKIIDFKQAFLFFYMGMGKYHLWYLPVYMVFLASLPFLRAMVQNISNQCFDYLFAIAIIFKGILPSVELRFLNSQYPCGIDFGWLLGYVVLYPCLGYYLQNRLELSKVKKRLLPLWIANMIGLCISAYLTYFNQVTLGEIRSQQAFRYFSVINCVTVFLTIRYLFEKVQIGSKMYDIISYVGKCTFGIYLVHLYVLEHPLMMKLMLWLDVRQIPHFAMAWCEILVTFLISFILVCIWNGIRFSIKKIRRIIKN